MSTFPQYLKIVVISLLWPIGLLAGILLADSDRIFAARISAMSYLMYTLLFFVFAVGIATCVTAPSGDKTAGTGESKRRFLPWAGIGFWLPVGIIPGISGFGWWYLVFATVLPSITIYYLFRCSQKDITAWMHVILTGAMFLVLYFSWTINMILELGMLIIPITYFFVIVWAVNLLICLKKYIRARDWRKVAFILTLPIMVALLFTTYEKMNLKQERVRLVLNKYIYMKEIAEIQAEENLPSLRTWRWGEIHEFPTGISYYVLLYDDSDQIFLPPQSRTAAWKQSFAGTRYSEFLSSDPENWNERLIIEHLEGHFYLVRNYK